MLTPQEISEKEFVKAVFGGYDMAVVDDFLETLSGDYSSLYKENAILKSKIKVLVEKVEEYRSTEDAMRMALLTAQKMGDNLLKNAKTKSEDMISSAKEEADKTLSELHQQVNEEETRLKAAREATTAFVWECRSLTAKLDKFLDAVPSLEIKPKEEKVQAPPPEVAREEEIMDAVHDIDSAMTKITEDDAPAPTPEAAAPAPAQIEPVTPKYDDEGEYTSPRPKFDFDNLRFGTNYSDDD